MTARSRFWPVVMALIALLAESGIVIVHARREYTEQELFARIQREGDPVKKAKYQIQLGRLKLQQAIERYGRDDQEHGQPLLSAYLEQMKGAWETLEKSGRPAVKKPQGFRELDIALREDARLLEDLKRRTPYLDRAPVEKIADGVEKLHEKVLQAIFPSLKNQNSKNSIQECARLAVSGGRGVGMRRCGPYFPARVWILPLMMLAASRFATAQTDKEDVLTPDEADQLREQQDPGRRIDLYLDFAQARLDLFETFRLKQHDPKYDNGGYLDKVLAQYIAINGDLKDWIEDQYERQGDMRRGLRNLLQRGPKQLEELHHFQQTPDEYAGDYKVNLKDAIDNLSDALDGGTQALAAQEKQFGELKREAKEDARASKERIKEAKKRAKEEKKLQKKERKQQVPSDEDEN